MRNAMVVVAIVGAILIGLLDVAACLAVNGGVYLLPLGLVIVGLLLALAGIARRPKRVIDPRDVMTLVRLRLQAAALARHTEVLRRQPIQLANTAP